jgi:site-specific recombinase XerD
MHRAATIHAALQHLLGILKVQNLGCGIQEQTPIDIELEIYREYLVDICGCAQTTCNARLGLIRRMLSTIFDNAQFDFAQLTPEKLVNFIARSSTGRKSATYRANCVYLTSYLRFRALQGNEIQAFLAAIPHMAPPMPARLPVTMSDSELTTFFSAFDLTAPIGMRDFAIARCMADLALRRMEVLRLNIESFNWREGTLTLSHNKGQRERNLPLPVQTAEAIVRYLKEGRPVTNNRAIFVRHIAPFDDPLGVGAINDLIERALVRAGLDHQFHGTHLFRRTAATRMVLGGVSLKEIADTLGHKSLNSTKVYTRVDMNRLRSMAQAWPGSTS